MFKPYESVFRIGARMGRVRGDPITTALAHPTRRAAYVALAQSEEMSTVQLQQHLGVDRYNLYHHLKKLASLSLIENHRDQGRARWWRKDQHVDLPELLQTTAAPAAPAQVAPTPSRPVTTLASLAVDEEGRDVIVLGPPRLQGPGQRQTTHRSPLRRIRTFVGCPLELHTGTIGSLLEKEVIPCPRN